MSDDNQGDSKAEKAIANITIGWIADSENLPDMLFIFAHITGGPHCEAWR